MGVQKFYDKQGSEIGRIVTLSNGDLSLRDRTGSHIGSYILQMNSTFDRNGSFVARGNNLAMLLADQRSNHSEEPSFDLGNGSSFVSMKLMVYGFSALILWYWATTEPSKITQLQNPVQETVEHIPQIIQPQPIEPITIYDKNGWVDVVSPQTNDFPLVNDTANIMNPQSSPSSLANSDGGDVDASTRAQYPIKYPPAAARAGATGTTVILVTYDSNGTVLDVSVYKSSRNRDLDRAAMTGVRKWKISPGIKNGQQVGGSALVSVDFTL